MGDTHHGIALSEFVRTEALSFIAQQDGCRLPPIPFVDGRSPLGRSPDESDLAGAQSTNDVMKVLTLTTVLLLPGSMIAGLLGMNVNVPLNKDDPGSFWLVVAAIAVLAVAIIVIARARRWL